MSVFTEVHIQAVLIDGANAPEMKNVKNFLSVNGAPVFVDLAESIQTVSKISSAKMAINVRDIRVVCVALVFAILVEGTRTVKRRNVKRRKMQSSTTAASLPRVVTGDACVSTAEDLPMSATQANAMWTLQIAAGLAVVRMKNVSVSLVVGGRIVMMLNVSPSTQIQSMTVESMPGVGVGNVSAHLVAKFKTVTHHQKIPAITWNAVMLVCAFQRRELAGAGLELVLGNASALGMGSCPTVK